MPGEWLRWVWDMEKGEDAPEFKDLGRAQRIVGLLMRHMNDIAQTLHQAPEHYEPLLSENPNNGDPIPILDEWCCGFLKGIDLDTKGWLAMTVDNPHWLSTIALYGTPEGWETLKTKNLSLDEHKALASSLAGTVRNIHALSLALRLKQDPKDAFLPGKARRESVRNPGKVGRNDPCPCGSGKKFKQCHGS